MAKKHNAPEKPALEPKEALFQACLLYTSAFCFSNKVQMLEYYHNSSWLEHGGSPEHAVRTAFVYQINKYLKDKNLYKKGESAISFQDVQDLSLIHICGPGFLCLQRPAGQPRELPL